MAEIICIILAFTLTAHLQIYVLIIVHFIAWMAKKHPGVFYQSQTMFSAYILYLAVIGSPINGGLGSLCHPALDRYLHLAS